jgi:hypothetical protein
MATASSIAQTGIVRPATVETWFDSIVGTENSGIINGPQYKVELQGRRSNPFFGEGEVNGIVHFDGKLYSVPLIYDIYKDELVVKHLAQSGRAWFIQLDKKRVDEFVLSGRLFRNFDRGYHEVLFDGNNFVVLAKRTKTYEVRKSVFNYYEFDRTFIKSSNRWIASGRISTLLKIIPRGDEKEAKAFFNKNKIHGRLAGEKLMKAAAFVDELLNRKKQ